MRISLLALLLTITLSGSAQVNQNAKELLPDGPAVEFKSLTVDYGTIAQDSEPLRVFEFKNTGTSPLVITGAQGSCGCTVPSYPKEPILPGQMGEIEVRYDTKRVGAFTKSVTLTTNAVNNSGDQAAGTFVLTVKGTVNPSAPGQNPVEIQMSPK